jgi:hypothetical protein
VAIPEGFELIVNPTDTHPDDRPAVLRRKPLEFETVVLGATEDRDNNGNCYQVSIGQIDVPKEFVGLRVRVVEIPEVKAVS